MSDNIRTTPVPVDELWLADWAAEGIAALERYLAHHAAFAAYLEGRTGREPSDGDGDAAR
jgi:hypothetical protein